MNIKLSEVVSQFLDNNNLGQTEYAKAYRMAIRGLRDLTWDVVGKVKIEELTLDANKTAQLPLCCVKVLDFGISDGKGGIASFDKVNDLTYNEEVPKYRDDYFENQNNPVDGNYRYGFNDGYYGVGSLGVGSYNTIGRYTVGSVITVDANTKYNHFLIKYLSYKDDDCEYEINIMASDALVAYITWKFSMVGSRNSKQDQNYNMREYYREKLNAKLKIKSAITSELNKLARQSEKMAVKS